jgi:hypothetical protein
MEHVFYNFRDLWNNLFRKYVTCNAREATASTVEDVRESLSRKNAAISFVTREREAGHDRRS